MFQVLFTMGPLRHISTSAHEPYEPGTSIPLPGIYSLLLPLLCTWNGGILLTCRYFILPQNGDYSSSHKPPTATAHISYSMILVLCSSSSPHAHICINRPLHLGDCVASFSILVRA
jgi:hypothetical protein